MFKIPSEWLKINMKQIDKMNDERSALTSD